MQPWVWLTPYVFGFALLQVLLYRRFRRERSSPTSADGGSGQRRGGRTVETSTAEVGPCQHCGTVNEVHGMIRYCRVCVESVTE